MACGRAERRRAGCGLLAFGAWLVILMVTAGNHSRAKHTAVFLTSCMLLPVVGVCLLMDSKTRRGGSRR